MLGPIITAGIGALAFKLGMDAQKMRSKGSSCSEIAQELASDACETVRCAASYCADKFCELFPCFCCCEEEEEPVQKPKAKKRPPKSKKKKPAKKPAAAPTPAPAA